MTNLMTTGWQNGMVVARATAGANYSPINTILRNFTATGTNYVSLAHPDAVESLMKQALAEPDQTKLTSIMKQINKLMIDDYCTNIPICGLCSMYATTPETKNSGWLTGEDWTKWAADTYFNK